MKKIAFGLVISALIMLALPWLAVTFVKGDGGMAICFLLFFAVNPIYSVIIGAYAGKDVRMLWSLPVLSAIFFLAGTWVFFDRGEMACKRLFQCINGVYSLCVSLPRFGNSCYAGFRIFLEEEAALN